MAELQELKVAQLAPSRFNPRQNFDKDSLAELTESIREQGVLTPLLVRQVEGAAPTNGLFEIVAGERRYRAAKSAGLKTVPCVVRAMTDQEAREAQIIENLQRKDITALEEAQGFKALLALGAPLTKVLKDGETREQAKGGVEHLAKAIGKSPRYVYARMKLLELADPVKKALDVGKIEPSHAQELVALKPEQQTEMLERIEDQEADGYNTSVQELREEVKYRYSEKPKPPEISAKEKARRAKELERQKKADAAWKRKTAESEQKRKRENLVNERAIAALWPKLKTAGAKDRDWFFDVVLQATAAANASLSEAWLVSQGKPLPDAWTRVPDIANKFAKRPRAERVALAMLAEVIGECENGYNPDPFVEKLFRWAKIDRKAIGRELAKKEKDAAVAKPTADASKATSKTAGHKVQTSAKPKGKGRARKTKKKK